VSRPTIGGWQVCGLSPGKHVLTVCSSRGDFRCAFDTSTVVQLDAVEPRVHVHVDQVFVGKSSWTGQDLAFTLGNMQLATDQRLPVELPPQIALAWTEAGNEPHAYLCEPPRSPAPGCSRCGAASDPEPAGLLFAVVVFVLARRR
jgi:MYXO-CTERM domain-containing protein